MTDPRKPAFDAARSVTGALSPDEVKMIHAALDAMGVGRAEEPGDWLDLAVPLIQQFEGCKLTAYPDPGTGGDPWTIGWGSTGPGIVKGLVWTQAQADERFRRDVAHFGNGVEAALDGAATTDGQLAAMTSLAYNIGLGAFRKSTLLAKHRAGDHGGARAQFAVWNKAGGRVMNGLVRRRAAEAEIYAL